MDEALAVAWNEVVGPRDIVWYLGDFAIRQPVLRVRELLARLNGQMHLVAGNNDPDEVRSLCEWQSVCEYKELITDERFLVLCHYPLRNWNGIGNGAIQLHGHSHGRLKPLTRQVDVGVDACGFRPISLSQILAGTTRGRNRTG